jgi:hypothetical protein
MAGNSVNLYSTTLGKEVVELGKKLNIRSAVDTDEISTLNTELWKLENGLEGLNPANADLVCPQDRDKVYNEWEIVREMIRSVAKELKGMQVLPGIENPPCMIWSRVCFIKAICHLEKLNVLVDSLLRRPLADSSSVMKVTAKSVTIAKGQKTDTSTNSKAWRKGSGNRFKHLPH